MAFRLHVACNDHRDGVFQGYADSVYLEAIRLEGGRVMVAELPGVEKWQTIKRGRWTPLGRVRIGRIVLPYFASQEWYGNWCWNMYSVMKVDALRVLNYLLTQPHWHVFEAPEEIYDRLQLRVTVTPREWREMDVVDV